MTKPASAAVPPANQNPPNAANQCARRARWRIAALLAGLCVLFFFSLTVGRYPVAPQTAFSVLIAQVLPALSSFAAPLGAEAGEAQTVILGIRLPRIFAALLVGAALSVSGAAYQGLFRNPLVSPGILGVSAGAGFGAALAILLGLGMTGVQTLAFLGGMLAVGAAWMIGAAIARHGDPSLPMLLAGIVVGTLFTAFISLIKFAADPDDALPAITFWLMGSLAALNPGELATAAALILPGVVLLAALGWTLNALAFGDEEARALGVATGWARLFIIICATLSTAAAVAMSGIIALVGLIAPHLARMLVGPDHRVLLPVSALIGAILLLAVDDLARSLFAAEIPLGIVTAIIGAPFFLYLLHRGQKWT
jgi:iron complex transport system permease protein